MKMKMVAVALASVVAASIFPPVAGAADSKNAADAEKILARLTSEPQWKHDYTGEDFGWGTAYSMGTLLQRYESTNDTAYLDAAVKFYDAILAKMQTGPDGYKGFIGPDEYNNKFWCDDHVGDAILFDGILEFSTLVMRTPELKEKYSAKALEYVEAAKKDFFEKWDARKTYRTDGPFGFYVGWDQFGLPNELTNWKPHPEDKDIAQESNLSLPFNKDIDCGALALRIWQITGEEKYKTRAEQLFGYMKSRMQNYNGAMHWNYWEPAGQWDMATSHEALLKSEWNPALAKDSMRLWTAVHPRRNYQENEMGNIVLAYNAGIVFSESDIKAMIQTNLKVMWNGDEKNPLWANSNNDLLKHVGDAAFYFKAPNKEEHAGLAWAPLAQFDAEIRKLSGRRGGEGAAPTFDRLLVKGKMILIPEVYARFPMGNVRTVQMACVLPSIFASGETTVIDCKLIEPGELEVALYSADGKDKIATLKKGKVDGGSDGREGINYFLFNGTLPDGKAVAPGDYRVRWTVTGDGFREFPITIKPK